ncbi:pantetheine-phosphate adenylyltransferase [Mesomycoplasma neurolyticum]|uniref:Phosphopantetheine adenylyltransferase n=1 Tax=Mesomycoplasma neurolyticum TaxID=2120 RepID=A0A449A4A0_9BACT|nr:pantetheine-phosphate adenylyltransferase [Mesomycoplasma neurolyticum]VEU59110.1 phosphopantetheine adenylyltransferase [Mesomycoplasma neurolyticum]
MQKNYLTKKALYPGSFAPFHEGHLSILKKALSIFDYVYLVITINPDKEIDFSFEKRKKIVEQAIVGLKNVEIIINDNNLTADIAKQLNVNWLIRSARNQIDFDYEIDLALSNKLQNNKLETILLVPDSENINKSSTLERHKAKLNLK